MLRKFFTLQPLFHHLVIEDFPDHPVPWIGERAGLHRILIDYGSGWIVITGMTESSIPVPENDGFLTSSIPEQFSWKILFAVGFEKDR